ncbi:hypothetical protein [Natrinema ejinorense]|uniref:Ig-like domain-containing protein n=1 Tax=Natrinema ejinorense TaxID=373386 RepID=A0A2A5QTW8_9EURY|nr:hypothetical protein [Natrinema ejinorense]PCR90296.1 hypothetical protein CP557_06925 [Natrinema ejinorense]
MHRRGFISATAAGLVSSAGCVSSDEQSARLAWITLRNHRDEEYDVTVAVEDDGDTVFSRTFYLGTTAETATVLEETPVEGEGEYVVHATMDGENRAVDTTDFIEEDERCLGVRFELLNNGSVDYRTKSMQQC